MTFLVLLVGKAEKDVVTCERAGLKSKLDKIKKTLRANPREPSQGFKRLKGRLKDFYSRRIDQGNRVVYTIDGNTECATDEHGNLYRGIVFIYSAWGHDYDLVALPS